MPFEANINDFSGPLDLMLHLIAEKKLDILNLDMGVLCDQYLDYLKKMDALHLEIESEYLVELATLIEYKSKKLLPKDETVLDDGYEEDPKEALIRRLLEYQKFKEVSLSLQDAYDERSKELAKPLSVINASENDSDDIDYDGNPMDLLKAMNRILRRVQLAKPLDTTLRQKEISIDDRILEIKAKLIRLNDTFSFDDLIEDCRTLHEYIVTFLAILDLAKDQILTFSTDKSDNIWFQRGVK